MEKYGIVNISVDIFSSLVLLAATFFMIRYKNKDKRHYLLLSNSLLLFIWIFGRFMEYLTRSIFGHTLIPLLVFYNIGVCFMSLSWMFTSFSFLYEGFFPLKKKVLFFIPPVMSLIMVATNEYHHLFFQVYNSYLGKNVYGIYYFVHCTYSFVYITIGIFNLVFYVIKFAGGVSPKMFLFFFGAVIPPVLSLFSSLGTMNVPSFVEPLSFTTGIVTIMYMELKFHFLEITPVALNDVVDYISDAFIAVDNKLRIVEFNKACTKIFGKFIDIPLDRSFMYVINNPVFDNIREKLLYLVDEARRTKETQKFQTHMVFGEFDKHFLINVVPILVNGNALSVIIFFKDITEQVEMLNLTEKNKYQLIEREKLMSLKQLSGSIAHNMKTPIMSSAGGLYILKNCTKQIDERLSGLGLCEEQQEFRKLIDEMYLWEDRVREYINYMSEVINSVREKVINIDDQCPSMGQANGEEESSTEGETFTVSELIKKVDFLINFECTEKKCTVCYNYEDAGDILLRGDINILIQVIINIISNAIGSYDNNGGTIEFSVEEVNSHLEISIKDSGKGINPEVMQSLLKKMVTTKGKGGMGLGLYLSNSMIKAQFNGSMDVESKLGAGTLVTMRIPLPPTRRNISA